MPVAGGMFGVTPQEVYQQQQAGINQSARDIAGMDGFTAAKYAMGQVGGALARPVAGMLGMKNPQMEEAQQAQDIQSQIDHSTSEGLMKGAQLFNQAGNPRMAMMYQQAAQAMEAQAMEAQTQQAKIDYYNTKANAPAAMGRPVLSTDDSGVTTAVWPDGTTKELGRIGKTKSQGSAPAVKGTWVDAERAGLKGQENTVTGEFKPYPNQDGGTRGTPAQQFKEKQQKGKDTIALKSMDTQLKNLTDAATALKQHKGLSGATGMRGVFPSVPGGDAAQAEVLLEEFRAATKNAGLQLVRQGGSIGAMTEKEWPIVEAMVANLDPKSGKKALQDQIDKVVAKMEQVRNDAKSNYDTLYTDVPSDETPAGDGSPEEWVRDASGKLVRK